MTMKPDGERIASLEQHMADQDKKLAEISGDIKDIKQLILNQASYEIRIKRLEDSSNLWQWISPSMAAVLGSILTFLLTEYLKAM